MPHRLITAGIILFWLGMTGWLIQREVVPMMLAEASAPFQPDIADEVGAPVVTWLVLRDGKRIGSVRSQVRPAKERGRDFFAHYTFGELKVGPIDVDELDMSYRVSDDGKLERIAQKMKLRLGNLLVNADLIGEVRDGEIAPALIVNKEKVAGLGKVQFMQKGPYVNPMHLLNRQRGLHDGRTWAIAMPEYKLDNKLIGDLFKQVGGPSDLIAVVKTDTMVWQHKEVECFKIEYHEPGMEPSIWTWVRKADGLVLKQEASQFGFNMVLQRMQ